MVEPDLAVFRSTDYFTAAMRIDLSLEDNFYTRYLDFIEKGQWNKVYSSPTFRIYSVAAIPVDN